MFLTQISPLHCHLWGCSNRFPPAWPCSTPWPCVIYSFLGNQMPACKCDFLLCKDYLKKINKLSLKKISRSKRKPSFKSHLYCRELQEILSVSAGWSAVGMLLPCSQFCITFKYIRQFGISNIGESVCACLSFNECCACVDSMWVLNLSICTLQRGLSFLTSEVLELEIYTLPPPPFFSFLLVFI